jgi:PhoH-like ATPase
VKIVLDTSAVIINPDLLANFLENPKADKVDIILPLTVLKELGKFKHESSERGKHARDIFRYLKQITAEYSQNLSHPIEFDNGSTLVVELECPIDLDGLSELGDNDSRIICVAKRHEAVLYTQDNAMEILANAFGIETVSEDRQKSKHIYEGITLEEDTEMSYKVIDIYNDENNGFVEVYSYEYEEDQEEYLDNQFVILKSGKTSAVTRFSAEAGGLYKIDTKRKLHKVSPNSVRQSCAVDLILDNEIRIAGLIGNPGTGKTYLALAGSLDLVLNAKKYKKLIIVKSAVGVGGDNEALGFLPGELNAKIEPIFSNLTGHLKTLLNDNNAKGQTTTLQLLRDKGIIDLKPVQYIRGENFSESLILIDEIQNFSLSTIKTLLTRVDYNTSKVIFTGDNEQVDNPYLNSFNNGLYSTVERLKGKPYFGIITLDKSCRGEITSDLVELFE